MGQACADGSVECQRLFIKHACDSAFQVITVAIALENCLDRFEKGTPDYDIELARLGADEEHDLQPLVFPIQVAIASIASRTATYSSSRLSLTLGSKANV